MTALESNEILEYYHEHGLLSEDQDESNGTLIPNLKSFKKLKRIVFESNGRVGPQANTVNSLMNDLTPWKNCLVVLTVWGIWPSNEDWPQFYAWRIKHGIKRSLETAPGHEFEYDEKIDLQTLLAQMMEFGWQGYVLFANQVSSIETVIFVSHDGWLDILCD